MKNDFFVDIKTTHGLRRCRVANAMVGPSDGLVPTGNDGGTGDNLWAQGRAIQVRLADVA